MAPGRMSFGKGTTLARCPAERTRIANPSGIRNENSKGATPAMDRRDEITPLCSLCREDQVLEALTETQLMIVSL